tara:strand:+ start:273 stop:482 length:210 start_codon:yes stop_codon:yes gene_type:complete
MTNETAFETDAFAKTYRWYSVSTPSVFAEEHLPEWEEDDTPSERRRRNKLGRIAKAHGTYVESTGYRRG